MKKLMKYTKSIAFILVFALVLPMFSGLLFATPAYAFDGLAEKSRDKCLCLKVF